MNDGTERIHDISSPSDARLRAQKRSLEINGDPHAGLVEVAPGIFNTPENAKAAHEFFANHPSWKDA